MSSNIQVQRICQQCGNEFTAKTTKTQYCSATCAKRAYKTKLKAAKIEVSNTETQHFKAKPFEDLKQKEFLTIDETCRLLSISRWTIWRLIKKDELKASKIGRRSIIRRSELDKLLS